MGFLRPSTDMISIIIISQYQYQILWIQIGPPFTIIGTGTWQVFLNLQNYPHWREFCWKVFHDVKGKKHILFCQDRNI